MNLLNDGTFMTVAGNSLCTKSTKPSRNLFWCKRETWLDQLCVLPLAFDPSALQRVQRLAARLLCLHVSPRLLRFHGISSRPMESGSHPLSQWIQSPTRSCEDWVCSQHGCAIWRKSMRCKTESALKLIISACSDLKESPAQPHSPQKLVRLWGGFYPHLLPTPDFGLRIATDCTHACKALPGWLNFDKPHPRKGVNLCLGKTTVDDCWIVLLLNDIDIKIY